MVRCAGNSGADQHTLYARVNGEETYLFDSNQEGDQVSLGILPVGTLIEFRLDVHQLGYNFYTAGSEQNPDSLDHVQIISTENPFIWECGFEDSFGEVTADFTDALFFVSGVSAVTSSPELGVIDGIPVEVEKIVKVPVEVIKEVEIIKEVPVEVEKIVYVDKIVEVPGTCADGECNIQGLEYKELKAIFSELKGQIKGLKACRRDVKKAIKAAKPKKVKKYKDDNGHGNDPGRYDPSNPGKKYKN
jgi:hypothetical protein